MKDLDSLSDEELMAFIESPDSAVSSSEDLESMSDDEIMSIVNPPSLGARALDAADRGIRQVGTGARMGIAPTIGEPKTIFEKSARVLGQTIPFSLALPLGVANRFATGAKAVAAETGFVGKLSQGVNNIADDMAKFIAEHPAIYSAGEVAAGAGAGAGGGIM